MRVSVHGQVRSLVVPLTYELTGNELKAQGQLALKQSDLGLTPFSALGGAMRVQDEVQVKFRFWSRGLLQLLEQCLRIVHLRRAPRG